MIDNLKLELGVQDSDPIKDTTTLEPSNTNVTETKTVALATGGRTGGSNFTTTGLLTVDNTDASGTNYDNYNAWRQVDPSNATSCANGNAYNSNSKTGCGYLYNFYTATASTVDNTKINGKADYSICPVGWRLPSGQNSSGDYGNLDTKYDGGNGGAHYDNIITQGLWLSAGAWQGAFSGRYSIELNGQGSSGTYWSSTIVSSYNAYSTFFYGSGVNPGNNNAYSRYNGFAIRCLVS
jgi:uncharacterized protein (TIGR02145 family)